MFLFAILDLVRARDLSISLPLSLSFSSIPSCDSEGKRSEDSGSFPASNFEALSPLLSPTSSSDSPEKKRLGFSVFFSGSIFLMFSGFPVMFASLSPSSMFFSAKVCTVHPSPGLPPSRLTTNPNKLYPMGTQHLLKGTISSTFLRFPMNSLHNLTNSLSLS